MTTETIKELIGMCRDGRCLINLEACSTGIVAKIKASRGSMGVEMSVWLDANDKCAPAKLTKAVRQISEVA